MEEATYRGTVYPWQCDHIGHMNIMWYVGKFDEANWNMFARLGLTPSYLRRIRPRHGGACSRTSAYKRELFAGDIIEVTSRLLETPRKIDPLPARDAQRRDRRDRRHLRDHRRAHGPQGAQIGAVRGGDPQHRDEVPCRCRAGGGLSAMPRFEPKNPDYRTRRGRDLRPAAGDAHARHFDRAARGGRGRSGDGLFGATSPSRTALSMRA